MNERLTEIREAAIGWAMRVNAPEFADWADFTRWLEEDAAHAAIFDEVALAGDAAAALPYRPEPIAAPPAKHRWRFAAGGLIAAGIVGALGWTASTRGDHPYAIGTVPGETRTIALNGTEITLDGGTRIALDRNHPRMATLEHGEALFTVRHDPANPFRLRVGDTTIEDVGTRFDVLHAAGVTRVAVAEGEVLYDPAGAAMRVPAGQAIDSRDGSDRLTLAHADPATVGGWTMGRFAYRDTPLAVVAADLARASGTAILLSPVLRAKTFTGVVALTPARRLPPDLGALLDVSSERDHGRIWLTAKVKRTRP